jgi:DNA-binding PadR family transcriptional regulator
MKPDPTKYLPLLPASLHILLALSAGELHGYAIMQEVARQSDGQYKLGPGTLYDNLQRLTAQGLVEEAGARDGDDDPRRRYYRLGSLGRGVLSAEVERMEAIVHAAKLRLARAKFGRA